MGNSNVMFFNKQPYNFGGVEENIETNYGNNGNNNYTVKANKIEGLGTYYIGMKCF